MILKKKLNQLFFFFLIVLMLSLTLFLSACEKEEIIEVKNCTKTTIQEYREYLGIPGGTVDYFSKVNIALILDTSGSMAGEKITKAKEASHWLLKELDPRINIALFEFNTNATMKNDFTIDRDALSSSIDSLKSGGSTYFVRVLDMAKRSFSVRSSKSKTITDIVIFLSDGQPKDSYKEIIREIKDMTSERICIYTIQYTSEEDKDLEAELKELEKVLGEMSKISIESTGCGKLYSDVGGQNSLVDVFKDIYTQIKTINYEAFFEFENTRKIFLNNETIYFPFHMKSIYNLNEIPNNKACIDPIDFTPILLDDKNVEISQNTTVLKMSDGDDENSFEISNLSKGRYSLSLNSFFGDSEENSIKAYRKFDFEVVTDKEYLRCDSYSCLDFKRSIEKENLLEKKVILTDKSCSLNARETLNRSAEITFFNIGKSGRIVYVKDDRDVVISRIIRSNESWSHTFGKGIYEIDCSLKSDSYDYVVADRKKLDFESTGVQESTEVESTVSTEGLNGSTVSDIKKNMFTQIPYSSLVPYSLVIDTSMSMSNARLHNAKIISAKLIENNCISKSCDIATFNDNAAFISRNESPELSLKKLQGLSVSGNSKIFSLLTLLNKTYLSKPETVKQAAIKPVQNKVGNLSVNQSNSTNDLDLMHMNSTSDKIDSITTANLVSSTSVKKIPKPIRREIVIFSDGLVYEMLRQDTLDTIYNLTENIVYDGICINAIVYGEDDVLKKIVNISKKVLSCGKIYSSVISEEIITQKIIVDDYFKEPFDITARIFIDNSTIENKFSGKVVGDLEISVYENNIDSKDNYFNIVCPSQLTVNVDVYRDSSLIFSKRAEKITENLFVLDLNGLQGYNYRFKITASLTDKRGRSCPDISSYREMSYDFSSKLITS
jgi:uncharacterized protein YegL